MQIRMVNGEHRDDWRAQAKVKGNWRDVYVARSLHDCLNFMDSLERRTIGASYAVVNLMADCPAMFNRV